MLLLIGDHIPTDEVLSRVPYFFLGCVGDFVVRTAAGWWLWGLQLVVKGLEWIELLGLTAIQSKLLWVDILAHMGDTHHAQMRGGIVPMVLTGFVLCCIAA